MVLAITTLYMKLYDCNTLDSRLDLIELASHSNSPEGLQWLADVRSIAAKIQKEVCDFSDGKKLQKDETGLRETEEFLAHQSDLLPCQVYSARELALLLKHAGKL